MSYMIFILLFFISQHCIFATNNASFKAETIFYQLETDLPFLASYFYLYRPHILRFLENHVLSLYEEASSQEIVDTAFDLLIYNEVSILSTHNATSCLLPSFLEKLVYDQTLNQLNQYERIHSPLIFDIPFDYQEDLIRATRLLLLHPLLFPLKNVYAFLKEPIVNESLLTDTLLSAIHLLLNHIYTDQEEEQFILHQFVGPIQYSEVIQYCIDNKMNVDYLYGHYQDFLNQMIVKRKEELCLLSSKHIKEKRIFCQLCITNEKLKLTLRSILQYIYHLRAEYLYEYILTKLYHSPQLKAFIILYGEEIEYDFMLNFFDGLYLNKEEEIVSLIENMLLTKLLTYYELFGSYSKMIPPTKLIYEVLFNRMNGKLIMSLLL